MMKSLLFLLLCPFLLTCSAELLFAQSDNSHTISGRIVSAETGEPLNGTHVILSGTTIGTVTDEDGRYELTSVPHGAHRIYVSIIGYENIAKDTLISESTNTMDFAMKEESLELDELEIADEVDEDWMRNYKRFKREFIGTSSRSDSVEIKNREVLNFDRNWWGRMRAYAMEPLELKNHHLGYRIIYHLDEFQTGGLTTKWDGEPVFEELNPTDSTQASEWEENREDAFLGSFRHFLLSLVNGRSSLEGFIVYLHDTNQPQDHYGQSSRRENRDQLMRYDEEKEVYKLNFFGELEITYTEDGESEQYVRWSRNHREGRSKSQTSYLEMNDRPVTVDSDGEILETYGVTRYGYFAYRRIADVTPREYRPDLLENVLPFSDAN